MSATSWLIGSYENLALQTFTVDTGADPQAAIVTNGDYLLIDNTSAISLAKTFEQAIEVHTGVAAATVEILENRKLKLTVNVAISITWGTATLLRDILGFTGDLGSSTTHTAPNVSAYMWSPGRTETPTQSILGVSGNAVYDTAGGVDAAGTTVIATENTSRQENTFKWRMVTSARYWTTAEAGGEYRAFFDAVLKREWSFVLRRLVDEDLSGSTAVSITSANRLGPYKMLPSQNTIRLPFARESGFQQVDAMHPVTLPVVVVEEFT